MEYDTENYFYFDKNNIKLIEFLKNTNTKLGSFTCRGKINKEYITTCLDTFSGGYTV